MIHEYYRPNNGELYWIDSEFVKKKLGRRVVEEATGWVLSMEGGNKGWTVFCRRGSVRIEERRMWSVDLTDYRRVIIVDGKPTAERLGLSDTIVLDKMYERMIRSSRSKKHGPVEVEL